jgi:hypothetical protein
MRGTGASSTEHAVLQVCCKWCDLRSHTLKLNGRIKTPEQRGSSANQDGHNMKVKLINEAKWERLLHDGSTKEVDILRASDLLSLLDSIGHTI